MPNNFERQGYDPRYVGGSNRYRVEHLSSPRDPREEDCRRLDVGFRDHSPLRSDRERSGYHSIPHRHSRDMDIDKSKLALDIINAVIGYKSSVNMRDRSPPRKQFRADRGRQRPHEDLPRDHHHSQSVWERLGEGGPTYHHPSLSGSGDHQDCRMAKSHQSQPLYKARTSKSSSRDPQPKEGKAVPNPRRGSAKRNRWEANEGTERHASEHQRSPEKTRKNVNQEKGEEEELSEEFLSLPRKALKCHVCDKKLFVSSKSYMDHIRGRAHKILRAAYQDNINAQISLLQANSQMAEYQQMTNSKLKFLPKRKCNLCKCRLALIKREHNRTKEHRELVKYMHVRCCGINFFKRDEYEDHRLTLEHHKNEWYNNREISMKKEEEEKNQKEEEDQQEEKGVEEEAEQRKKCADLRGAKPPNEEMLFGNIVEELYRKSHHPEVTSLKSLEPYDPSVPHGLNFISKKSTYQCGVCPNSQLVNGNTIEQHFHSLLHYNNLCAHLELLNDKKELKERNEKKMDTETVEEKRTSGLQEPKEKLEEEKMDTEEKSKVREEEDKVKVTLLWVKDQDQEAQEKKEEEPVKENDRGEQEKEELVEKIDQDKEEDGEETEDLAAKVDQDKDQDTQELAELVKKGEQDKQQDREVKEAHEKELVEKIDQDKEEDGEEPEDLAAKVDQDKDQDTQELAELVKKGEQDKQQDREVKEAHENEEHIKKINQDKEQDKEEQETEELIEKRVQDKKQYREENEKQAESGSQEKEEEQEKKQGKQEEEVDNEEKKKREEEENSLNEDEVDLTDIDNMETVDEVCDDDEMGDQDSSVGDEDDDMINLLEVGEEIDTKIYNVDGEEHE